MKMYGTYHRLGAPGGPGCRVAVLPAMVSMGGSKAACALLDAGTEASELQLLRTVAGRLNVKWGHDDLGWWAAVPDHPVSAFAAETGESEQADQPHALYREDDNGGRFLVGNFNSKAAAEARASELASGGHKQFYYTEPLIVPAIPA